MAELYRSDIVDVDIGKSLLRTYAGIILNTGDCKANRFGANIIRAGEPVDISRCAVVAYFMRPNTETVLITGVVEGNTAYVDLPAACYTQEGTFSLALKVSSTDITQTVRVIDGCIRLTHTDTVIDPGDVIPSLDELFAKIADMEAATAEATASAADARAAAEENEQRTTDAIAQVNATLGAALGDVSDVLEDAAPAIVARFTGDVVKIADASSRPALSVMSQIAAVQAGTGDPSPENVRPITGWDKVTVQRTGKNLFNPANLENNGTTNEISDDTYTIKVTGKDAYTVARYDIGEMLKPGATVYFAMDDCTSNTSSISPVVQIEFTGQEPLRKDITKGNLSISFVVPSVFENAYIKLYANPTANALQDANTCTYKGVRLFYEDVEWEAYLKIDPITAALPETVYGGTLDWTRGLLTVTHERITVTGAQVSVFESHRNNRVMFDLSKQATEYNVDDAICDRYKYDQSIYYDSYDAVGFVTYQTKAMIRLGSASNINTEEKAIAYFDVNPATIVYKLAEPYTIQLTPQQLYMMKGSNVIWSDSGNTSVRYVADTKLYIDELKNAILAQGANI